MRIELHEEAVEELGDEWRDLHAADPLATPFVSPAWALASMRHYSGEARSWVLTAHENGRLIGLAPLAIRRERGIRALHVPAEQLADYWDVLALPAAREAVLDAFAAELRRRAGGWAELTLGRLQGAPGTGADLEHAGALAQRRVRLPVPG